MLCNLLQIPCMVFVYAIMMTDAYILSTISTDFTHAISYCKEAHNSSLATVFTVKQHQTILKLCSAKCITNCWVGLHTQLPDMSAVKDENCVEIIANIDRNDTHKFKWKKISCDLLRCPICNDPPSAIRNMSITYQHEIYHKKHSRKLLQTQNMSCGWIDTDYNYCIINASYIEYANIICDPEFANCEIYLYNVSNSVIHCPSKDCEWCIIDCYGDCQGLIIKGNNCQFVSLLSLHYYHGFGDSIIHAPGNGGSLEIFGDLKRSHIYSKPETENIVVIIDGAGDHNVIDARYVTGHVNVSCIGFGYCDSTNISCAESNASFIINCSSINPYFVRGGCQQMIVSAEGDTSNVDWYCSSDLDTVCSYAMLISYIDSVGQNLKWAYDYFDQLWYYYDETSNISCNWPDIDNDTCIIYPSDIGRDVECDPELSNCEINVLGYLQYSTIHCPTNDCQWCIVNCFPESICKGLVIKGYDCELVSILATVDGTAYENCTIYAPGNGGTLEITGGMSDSIIYSQLGTENIVITQTTLYVRHNIIDGQYISGDLNVTCNGSCDEYYIMCGANNTNCNIYCLKSCQDMIVYATKGTSDVKWICSDTESYACLQAKLACSDMNNPLYSEWRYSNANGWYYDTGDCVQNWIPPDITCTLPSKIDDTCYITKQYLSDSRTIQCNTNFTNCQVQLGDVDSNNAWQKNLQSTIHCPSVECDTCIIQCNSEFACYHITIFGYNCSSLQVIVAHYQDDVTIHAPGNGGNLLLNTYIERVSAGFSQGQIYSSPYGTKNMIINFAAMARANYIDGTYVTDYLNVTCNELCFESQIICPNDAHCNIDCNSNSYCGAMIVKAIEGTHDVNWLCAGGKYMCDNAVLFCKNNFSQSSSWEYDNITGIWHLGHHINGGCIDLPTIAPTPSPTIPTMDPTEPTAAPTKSPIAFSLDITESIGIIGGSLLLCIFIFCGLIYYYRYYKPEKKALYISNGLVILIGIGEYDEEAENPEIESYLKDLSGIDKDIENMVHLFHDTLCYDVYPTHYFDDIENDRSPKQYWTEQELHNFLENHAQYLEDNAKTRYDGLIVIISCHGVSGNICTSDYKLFSQRAIHRIFSSAHPNSRGIPRFFIFDCCSGNFERESYREDDICKSPNSKISDLTKGINDADADIDKPWVDGEHNPDYKLCVIEAANPGFQSKLRSDVGSYVIHSFYEKTMDILTNNKRTFIHETFDEIQD
eukprot:250603_1